jgi:hypothetical protein
MSATVVGIGRRAAGSSSASLAEAVPVAREELDALATQIGRLQSRMRAFARQMRQAGAPAPLLLAWVKLDTEVSALCVPAPVSPLVDSDPNITPQEGSSCGAAPTKPRPKTTRKPWKVVRHDHGVDPFARLAWVYSAHTTELAARRARDRVKAVTIAAESYEEAARWAWSVVHDPAGSLINPPDTRSGAR